MKHQLKTDIRGVNVWPYASVMLDESRSRSRSLTIIESSFLHVKQADENPPVGANRPPMHSGHFAQMG